MSALPDLLDTVPTWKLVALGVLLIAVPIVLALALRPLWHRRRAVRHFAALARACGTEVEPGPDRHSASFEIQLGGRGFTLRREMRAGDGGQGGPIGHLLVVETMLAGDAWARHAFDLGERGSLSRSRLAALKTGDVTFDKRFRVRQGGAPVRPRWLDTATRAAVTAFFDLPAVGGRGTLWALEGRLRFLIDRPARVDGPALAEILAQMTALAAALERTAARRVEKAAAPAEA